MQAAYIAISPWGKYSTGLLGPFMKYKVFFFDADDTLFDFKKSAAVSFAKAMDSLGVGDKTPELFTTFKEISAKLWAQYENNMIDKSVIRYKRFVDTFEIHEINKDPIQASKTFLNNLCENVFLIEGAEETLAAIKKEGLPVGVLTNGVAEVQSRRLKNTNIQSHIDFMVVSEECEAPKPHPSMFEKAMELSGASAKKEVLMMGDSLTSDITGAKKFGIDSCWFNPNDNHHEGVEPTYEITCIKKTHQFL